MIFRSFLRRLSDQREERLIGLTYLEMKDPQRWSASLVRQAEPIDPRQQARRHLL